MAHDFPEVLGDFHLYSPISGTSKTGWTLSWHREWLPGSYDSRDALMVVMGMVRAYEGVPRRLRVLQERHNRAVPSEDITVEHLLGEDCDHPNGFGSGGCSGCGATR